MNPMQLAVVALRIGLVGAFTLLVLFQTMSLPGQFEHMAKENPADAYLRWPLTIFAVLLLGCVEAVIVCTWKLLTMVQRNRIFSNEAFRWLDVIIGAVAAAWVMVLIAFIYVGIRADDPGVPLLLFLFVVGGAVLNLLLVVIRAVLRQAVTLHTDMEAVI